MVYIDGCREMDEDMEEEELEEWRTIFNLFDVDGDQSITCEVASLFSLLGLSFVECVHHYNEVVTSLRHLFASK